MAQRKTVAKYPKLCALLNLVLLGFLSSYMMENGFTHMHYLLAKQRSSLNIECTDLQLKRTNLQLNNHDLSAHQMQLSN